MTPVFATLSEIVCRTKPFDRFATLMRHVPAFVAMTNRNAATQFKGVVDFKMNRASSAFNMVRKAVFTPRLAGKAVSVGRGIAGNVDAVVRFTVVVVVVAEPVLRAIVVAVFGMTFF